MPSERDYPYQQRIVSLGGGTGHYIILRGLSQLNYPEGNTAIAAVWDSGGSSGQLRVEEGILPPGDVMQCLLGLMEDSEQLEEAIKILKDRSGGHPLVNQLLIKSAKVHNGAEAGIDGLRKLFRVRGRVIPVSLDNLDLHAESRNGVCFDGEKIIDHIKEDGGFRLKDNISRIFLEPKTKANPKVIEALAAADKIVFPPGSPYTSIFPHLLIPGISETILHLPTPLVVALNLMTTQGEDHHLTTASRWLRVFQYYLGDQEYISRTGRSRISYLVVNDNHIDQEIVEIYKSLGQNQVLIDKDECLQLAPGLQIVRKDMVRYIKSSHLLRHDPVELARVVLDLPTTFV